MPLTATPLQVLLVEDNAGDARLFREMFSGERPGSFELTHFSRMGEAEIHLAKGGVDIVLLDLGLPDGHGLDTVRRARAAAPGVPMIVLTGLDDEVLAAEAMNEGAQDYLIKGQIENRALPRALRHAIERHGRVEADLVQTKQLLLKDEFLSHVSHELRSPLTSIYSFGTIIADGLAGTTNPQQDEYLQIILRNVRQLQAMIEDLLAVTQVHEGKLNVELQRISASEAIIDAVDTLQGAAASKGIVLSFDSLADMPPAYADPTRLRQILIILVDNAIKFTPVGGAVGIKLRVSEEDPGYLLVNVSDTGCGISAEMVERIFEHLYQINDPGQAGRKGLGLGLYIAKELVTRQRGKIWVTSDPVNGSDFSFTVPIFSTASLIGSMLAHEKKAGENLVLLTMQVFPRDDSPEAQRKIADLTRNLLQQCLRPDADVLLPNICAASERMLFFVVGYTLEHGAEVISERIRSQFKSNTQFSDSESTFTISHDRLVPLSRDCSESMEAFVQRVATGIEHRISAVCLQEGIEI